MKKIVEISESGMESLMGKKITLFCLNYIYTGELIGVTDTCVLLKDPAIVYETGSFTDKEYSDVQSLQVEEFFIATNCIESFGVLK